MNQIQSNSQVWDIIVYENRLCRVADQPDTIQTDDHTRTNIEIIWLHGLEIDIPATTPASKFTIDKSTAIRMLFCLNLTREKLLKID